MSSFGYRLLHGRGIGKDDKQAVIWLRRAAEQEQDNAMCNLGWCYERGHGVPQDWKQAVEWYRRAAQAGNTVAMGNLGWCYEKGKGVEKRPGSCGKLVQAGSRAGFRPIHV